MIFKITEKRTPGAKGKTYTKNHKSLSNALYWAVCNQYYSESYLAVVDENGDEYEKRPGKGWIDK